jgi:hypothetical protein
MTLGNDLVLLAIDPRRGKVSCPTELGVVLVAAELVDLVNSERIKVVSDQVVVTHSTTTGDALLDATLAELAEVEFPPTLPGWINRQRIGRTDRYLQVLGEERILRETREQDGPGRVFAADDRHRANLIARLKATAAAREPALEDQIFAGLAHAAHIPDLVLSGFSKRRMRRRLAAIAAEITAKVAAEHIDAYRYLPGCPPELAVDAPDGGHLDDTPTTLRLVAAVAISAVDEWTSAWQSTSHVSDDVRNAIRLSRLLP